MAAERVVKPANVPVRSKRRPAVRATRLPDAAAAQLAQLRQVLGEDAPAEDDAGELLAALWEMRCHRYGSREHQRAEARVALAFDAAMDGGDAP